MSEPREPLTAPGLESLGETNFWRRIEIVAETGSTNADLIARAAGEDIDGHVLVAEHQTAGRGRNGRTWIDAPSASLMLSVGVAARSVPVDAWGWLPLAAGVAVVDTARTAGVAAADCGVKWPNDVLAGPSPQRKLAGILAEVSPTADVIVVGIGINVTLTRREVADTDAVSLADLGARTDRLRLLGSLLNELGRRVDDWRTQGGASPRLIADYEDRSVTLGTEVRAMLPGGNDVRGAARGIDRCGRLIIDTERGPVVVAAGDVVHVRA